MREYLWPFLFGFVLNLVIVLGVALRVIMRRPATGVALAWLLLVTSIPFVGAIVYLLIGERRIGRERSRAVQTLHSDFRKIAEQVDARGLSNVDWKRHPPDAAAMDRLGRQNGGNPTVAGSSLTLISRTAEILDSVARDVDQAQKSVLMEFYIWGVGGQADEVLEAVIRAAKRGVDCRLLIDAVGAGTWWRSRQPQRLRDAGVQLRAALPVGLFRTLVGRTDLRLHRKIVVIDGDIAWTGSMNMVDPRYFKQDSGVGEWVDAMVRVQGAAVATLAATLIGDWYLETGEPLSAIIESAGLRLVEPQGFADVQVIASGPGQTSDGLLQMILAVIHNARDELTLTTPYLVPDDSLLYALRGAAGRGVRVSIIVPEKVDSLMTRHASRSYYDDLLGAGVRIYLYRGGLLHTKSIMADRLVSMFGTVNLDMRSLWLNYEVTMIVHDPEFATELRDLQQSYVADAHPLDPQAWDQRSLVSRFLENSMRLLSPLL